MSFSDITKVKALFFYTETEKIYTKYYIDTMNDDQKNEIEKILFGKMKENFDAQVLCYEDYVVVFKHFDNMIIALVSDSKANEMILDALTDAIYGAMTIVYKQVNEATVKQQIETFYLIIDEAIDSGYIFEGNGEVIAARVMLKDDKSHSGRLSGLSSF